MGHPTEDQKGIPPKRAKNKSRRAQSGEYPISASTECVQSAPLVIQEMNENQKIVRVRIEGHNTVDIIPPQFDPSSHQVVYSQKNYLDDSDEDIDPRKLVEDDILNVQKRGSSKKIPLEVGVKRKLESEQAPRKRQKTSDEDHRNPNSGPSESLGSTEMHIRKLLRENNDYISILGSNLAAEQNYDTNLDVIGKFRENIILILTLMKKMPGLMSNMPPIPVKLDSICVVKPPAPYTQQIMSSSQTQVHAPVPNPQFGVSYPSYVPQPVKQLRGINSVGQSDNQLMNMQGAGNRIPISGIPVNMTFGYNNQQGLGMGFGEFPAPPPAQFRGYEK